MRSGASSGPRPAGDATYRMTVRQSDGSFARSVASPVSK
jgi:hypothetical protein